MTPFGLPGAFGVGGAMADPVLTIYRGSDRLYSNDDWTDDTGNSNLWSAAQIQTAADSVGAFRLPNGSLDAVVMITLQPGSYSATVTGVNGGTGAVHCHAVNPGLRGYRRWKAEVAALLRPAVCLASARVVIFQPPSRCRQ